MWPPIATFSSASSSVMGYPFFFGTFFSRGFFFFAEADALRLDLARIAEAAALLMPCFAAMDEATFWKPG